MNNEQIPPKYKKAKLQLINAYYQKVREYSYFFSEAVKDKIQEVKQGSVDLRVWFSNWQRFIVWHMIKIDFGIKSMLARYVCTFLISS